MNRELLKKIIEAALMVSGKPLSVNQLQDLFEIESEKPERNDIRNALSELQADYADRGIELREIASGFRFQVRPDYAEWVNRLYDEKPPRYSRALLETLAIIAYRQPITRSEIEDIRGVSVSTNIIKTMQEREWVKVVGHRDVPGKPELLATTKQFLDYFNLKKLSDLPTLAEIKDFDQINPDLFDILGQEQGADVSVAVHNSVDDSEDQESDAVEIPVEQEERDPDDNVIPFSG